MWKSSLTSYFFCQSIYPSDDFKALYTSKTPTVTAITIAVAFAVVIVIFLVYDQLVRKRNENLVMKAARSNAVVSDLFPDAIRDKILDSEVGMSTTKKMKSFLVSNGSDSGVGRNIRNSTNEKALADLYLDTTCLFADISGKCVGAQYNVSTFLPSQNPSFAFLIFFFEKQVLRRGPVFEIHRKSSSCWKLSIRHSTG